MKKIISILLAISMLMCLGACSNNKPETTEPTIVETQESTLPTGEIYTPSETENMLLDLYMESGIDIYGSVWQLAFERLDIVESYTGLDSVQGIDEASVMTSAEEELPLVITLIKLAPDANIESIIQKIENGSIKKWGNYQMDAPVVLRSNKYLLIIRMDRSVVEIDVDHVAKTFEQVALSDNDAQTEVNQEPEVDNN